MADPFIQFVDVKKSFDANHVMQGINLYIYKGEITAVIGKSGCGKSVLLKHIIGLMNQDSGEILISGKDLSSLNKKEKKAFKNKLSYMFQSNALFDSLNIFDNIALPLVEKSSLSKEKIKEKVKLRMAQLEIKGTEENFPSELSGGMQKRVALARALVTDPDIVLFDEPTTGLDPVRKKSVHLMIKEYQKKFGFTAVVVSHEIPEVFDIAQRIAMLESGKIVFEGDKDAILNSDNVIVKSFIMGKEII
ncbi:MAG: ATP-binding cassette domain-containing protein [Desulfobacteraceae bacterium]|nr:ATP-binding cassette domain-containing protein [Desulfobacteraceae bacterium]